LPLPLTSFNGTPNSRANLRTEGDACGKPKGAFPGAWEGNASAELATAAGVAIGGVAVGAAACGTVAVAGFAESEIDVELKDNILTVKGTKEKKEPEITYTHKGISTRNFERTFTLNPEVRVKAATVQNGILAIALEHVIPEEQKAKKIAITFAK
jgi:hypothetical protein